VNRNIVIATRGSALALWQAEHVKTRLLAVEPGISVELKRIKTTGDQILDVPLAKVGGKGLFVKEIEQALIDRSADLAVHSMKDVPGDLAPGLVMAAVSSRESPWDALCTRTPQTLDQLAPGSRIGTSSLRRQAQLLALRPDLRIEMLRGNVPTRLARLDAGDFDAVILAAAGLTRLGLGHRISQELPAHICLPAVAQGVLGIETRGDDADIIELARRAIHDPREAVCVAAERGFLVRMGGNCQTPLAARAVLADGEVSIDVLFAQPDGRRVLRATLAGPAAEAQEVGRRAAELLIAQGASPTIPS
jgi:hydroxymethylbilane synthase